MPNRIKKHSFWSMRCRSRIVHPRMAGLEIHPRRNACQRRTDCYHLWHQVTCRNLYSNSRCWGMRRQIHGYMYAVVLNELPRLFLVQELSWQCRLCAPSFYLPMVKLNKSFRHYSRPLCHGWSRCYIIRSDGVFP